MSLKILVSSAGRRIGLIQCLQVWLRALGMEGLVLAGEISKSAPAWHIADHAFLVPRCTAPEFTDSVLELCVAEKISLVIPTIDTELPAFARARNEFAENGVLLAVSDPATVAIARDKKKTNEFFRECGIPTVSQHEAPAILDGKQVDWPLIAKPTAGSSSEGVRIVRSATDLRSAVGKRAEDFIVEEIAKGQEYTVSVYVHEGRVVCAVPRLRLATRGGEVSKGLTTNIGEIKELAKAVGEALPGARGPLNVQLFRSDDGGMKAIEINARLGGGYPLAHKAGAQFVKWLIQESAGGDPQYSDEWEDGLAMLRYDTEIFVKGSAL